MALDEDLVNWSEMRQIVVGLRELLELNPADPGNLNEALGNIIRVAKNLFPPTRPGEERSYPDICSLSIFNPFTQQFVGSLTVRGEDQVQSGAIMADTPFKRIVETAMERGHLFIEDLSSHRELQDERYRVEGIKSVAAVSFFTTKRHKKPLATLCLAFNAPHQFGPDKQDFLRMLADEGSSILQNTWLLRRYNDVAVIGQEINQEFEDIPTLFDKIRAHLPRIINTDHFFMLAVRQRQTDKLDLHLLDEGQRMLIKDWRIEGGSAHVVETNQSLLISDASAEPELSEQLVQIPGTNPEPFQSLIFVPLSFRGEVLGVLSVKHRQPNMFDNDDLHILNVLSYHISLALSNRRLFQSLNRLNETGRYLLQQLDSDQLMQILADGIRKTAGADLVVFYPYLRTEHRFDLPPRVSGALIQPDFPTPHASRSDDIASLALGQANTVFAADSSTLHQSVGGTPSNRLGFFEDREAIRSTAAVPLRVGDEEVGVLFVNYRTAQRFDAPQKLLIENLGNYAAVAIKNSRKFADQNKRQTEVLEALRRIDREISKTLDLTNVLQTILDLAIQYITSTKTSLEDRGPISIDGAILLYNSSSKQLQAKATAGPESDLRQDRTVSLLHDKGISSWAFENKLPVRVGDVMSDSIWKKLYFLVDRRTRSELDVPLLDGNVAIGVINLESAQVGAFSELDEDFLVTLAERAVLAIKNAQVFEREKRSKQELEASRDVERQIVNRQIIRKVFETILDGALLITSATSGHIALRDVQKRELYVAAEKGMPPDKLGLRMSEGEGIIGWVMQNKTVANVDLSDPHWRSIYRESLPGIKYELAVPIGLRDSGDSREVSEAFGVINLEKREEPAFSEEDVNSLTQFANQALVILQSSEGSHRAKIGEAKLSALLEIDLQIIGATNNPDDVMQVIVRKAMELTNADVGNLHIYEGDRPTITYCAGRESDGTIRIQNRVEEEDIEDLAARRGIVAHVAETLQPYRTPGDAQEDAYFKGSKNIHSNIAVPLVHGTDRIGVLNLESKALNTFNDDHVSSLEAIARQAVIAIQKVRGNIHAADSLKRFKLLSTAGQELLKLGDSRKIREAYNIIIEKVHEYLPCNAAVWNYDKEKEELNCQIEKGVGDLLELYHHTPLKKGDGVNGRVAELLKPIVIHDTKNLQEEQAVPVLSNPNTRSVAVYPIFIVDDSGETDYYGNLSLTHVRPRYFKEDDSELFTGLTQQLALTLHRLRTVRARVQAEQRAKEARLMSVIGQLAYQLTHGLGNLLGVVPSLLRQIQEEVNNKGIRIATAENLQTIGKQVGIVLARQATLTAKVSRFRDQGNLSAKPESLPVSTLLDLAKRSFPLFPQNIDLEVRDQTGHAQVRVVPDQIVEILFNLVSNAVEAMQGGGKITLTARAEGDTIEFVVQDTGEGIAAENFSRIFNPLFTTKADGTGFGLWSSRLDALANDGDLTVTNAEEGGAVFVLSLPRSSYLKRSTTTSG